MICRHHLAAVFVSAALGAAPTAQAGEEALARAATGVGYWIAAQGNAALRDIQEDLRDDLGKRLRPLLPAWKASDDHETSPREAPGA